MTPQELRRLCPARADLGSSVKACYSQEYKTECGSWALLCRAACAHCRAPARWRAGAQVVVISDPELAAQVLDRSRTPHQIDKPHEPMFYHVVDEVGTSLTA